MFKIKVSFIQNDGTEKVEFEQETILSVPKIVERLSRMGTPTLICYRLKKHLKAGIAYGNGVRQYEIIDLRPKDN